MSQDLDKIKAIIAHSGKPCYTIDWYRNGNIFETN
jgi:hypothetical protein